jgi:hypothetical protein
MVANRVRRRGSYAPLSAHYYKDDAIMRVGEKAELLFVRGLAFGADVLKNGFISDLQLEHFVGVGMRDAKARAAKLCEVNLWVRDDDEGGYWVSSWLEWNLSAEQISDKLKADSARKGGDHDHD